MGEIVGVPRQRQGQLVKGDLVGNTEIALEQSFLVTEIIYDEHDEIEAKALKKLKEKSSQQKLDDYID